MLKVLKIAMMVKIARPFLSAATGAAGRCLAPAKTAVPIGVQQQYLPDHRFARAQYEFQPSGHASPDGFQILDASTHGPIA
jgi:hypothetical protein